MEWFTVQALRRHKSPRGHSIDSMIRLLDDELCGDAPPQKRRRYITDQDQATDDETDSEDEDQGEINEGGSKVKSDDAGNVILNPYLKKEG